MTSNSEPTAVTATYFDAWRKGDLAALRSVLADDADFAGPLAQLGNADDMVQAMQGLVQVTTDIVFSSGTRSVNVHSQAPAV